jgi:hypothetical protein
MADEDDMNKVMGFSNFGGPKKAKQFDFMAMFEESRKTAIERSASAGMCIMTSSPIFSIKIINKLSRLKPPLAAASDLPTSTLYPVTDCCFSPDDKMVLTGTSVQRGHGTGKLVFLDKTNLSIF